MIDPSSYSTYLLTTFPFPLRQSRPLLLPAPHPHSTPAPPTFHRAICPLHRSRPGGGGERQDKRYAEEHDDHAPPEVYHQIPSSPTPTIRDRQTHGILPLHLPLHTQRAEYHHHPTAPTRPNSSHHPTALYWWYAEHRTAFYSSSSSSVGRFVTQWRQGTRRRCGRKRRGNRLQRHLKGCRAMRKTRHAMLPRVLQKISLYVLLPLVEKKIPSANPRSSHFPTCFPPRSWKFQAEVSSDRGGTPGSPPVGEELRRSRKKGLLGCAAAEAADLARIASSSGSESADATATDTASLP